MPYIGKEPAKVPVTAADIPDNSITAAKIVDGAITIADIADDAVTEDKLANAINTAIAANTAKVTNATHTGEVTGATALTIAADAVDGTNIADNAIGNEHIEDDAVGVAELSATGTASNTTFLRGDNSWVVPTDTNTVYTHPNHSGEVTSTADGAQVVADNIIDEANLKVSNSPTNGYALTAQSGNTGGLTWAEIGGGPSLGTDSIIRTNAQTISENITIGSTTNGLSAGPITIADTYTVTVNGNWSVV